MAINRLVLDLERWTSQEAIHEIRENDTLKVKISIDAAEAF